MRRNVYDKKLQRYAKDNRTANLTARSDESIAYVTNNKRLCSTFCTVEAILTDTKHRAASLRQQSCLLRYSQKTYADKRMNPIAYVMTAKLNPGSYFDLGGVCALGVLLSLFLHVLLSAVFTLHEHVVR